MVDEILADEVRIGLDEVGRHFEELEDPRADVNLHHPLESVLTIAVMAVLCGCDGPTAIARWGNDKSDLLSKTLELPFGIPQKDVFRRVLSALKPDAFQLCFSDWLNSLKQAAAEKSGVDQPVFAIDGKTLRRSHDRKNGLGPLHSVSAWASDFGLTLGQVACEEKSNEITAIPELLKLIDINGAIITIDAMGTQKKIAKQIIEGGGDFVLCLKGNQETAYQAAIDVMEKELEKDASESKARTHITEETGHGRTETRTYIQMPAPKKLPGFASWPGLMTIGVVILTCLRNGRETTEARYYISSLGMGVKRFAHAVRSHWAIENTCHWSLDITYREDESRIREQYLRENFAWLNRFTLSLLKQHPDKKTSLIMKRRSCGWNDDFLMEVLTGART